MIGYISKFQQFMLKLNLKIMCIDDTQGVKNYK